MSTTDQNTISRYTFTGRLCGYICDECPEALAGITVRLYRTAAADVTTRAVADAKETFRILTDDEVKAKSRLLIAETTADENGTFTFHLGREQQYDGGTFEIDGYCGTVPGLKPGPHPPAPLQFSITTLQPQWRKQADGLIAAWEYCISRKYWCAIRARFGAWTICGRVTVCESKTPVQGLTVKAFDADWLQDDPLGSGVTDASGKFRIDYVTADFEKTPLSPFINFELVSGPDVYFRIEAPGGTVLLNEPRSRARKPDRDNVSHCFCVELCVPKGGDDTPKPDTIPLFNQIGQYKVDGFFGEFTGEGRTTAGNYAFTDTIPLNGLLPDGGTPNPIEYRFRIAEYDATGTVLGPVSNVTPSMIASTQIGSLEYWDWDISSLPHHWVLRSVPFYANTPGAKVTIRKDNGTPTGFTTDVSVNVDPAPDGWIKAPTIDDLTFGGNGRYVAGNVTLANLATTTLVDESFDLTGPPAFKAGDSVPAAARTRLRQYRIFFQARRVIGGASVSTNDRERIAIVNTHYNQLRHPDWAGYVTNPFAVAMVDIVELLAGGCSPIGNNLHALCTAYHPALGSVTLSIEGNPPLPPESPMVFSPSGEEVASTPAGFAFTASGLKPCAYILHMSATVLLTSGYGLRSDATLYDHIAFCVK